MQRKGSVQPWTGAPQTLRVGKTKKGGKQRTLGRCHAIQITAVSEVAARATAGSAHHHVLKYWTSFATVLAVAVAANSIQSKGGVAGLDKGYILMTEFDGAAAA